MTKTKYYAWSGKHKIITTEKYPLTAAAVLCAEVEWKGLGKYVKVSEVGFNDRSGHPDHQKDVKFTVEFLRSFAV